MGRAERRKAERRARLEENKTTIRLRPSDITRIKDEVREEIGVYSVDMMLTCFALAEHRLYGYDAEQVLESLNYIDELMGAINDDSAMMSDYVQELKDELGLEIRTDGRKIG